MLHLVSFSNHEYFTDPIITTHIYILGEIQKVFTLNMKKNKMQLSEEARKKIIAYHGQFEG